MASTSRHGRQDHKAGCSRRQCTWRPTQEPSCFGWMCSGPCYGCTDSDTNLSWLPRPAQVIKVATIARLAAADVGCQLASCMVWRLSDTAILVLLAFKVVVTNGHTAAVFQVVAPVVLVVSCTCCSLLISSPDQCTRRPTRNFMLRLDAQRSMLRL